MNVTNKMEDSPLIIHRLIYLVILLPAVLTANAYPGQIPPGGSLSSESAETGNSLTLTYIINMGVLVSSAD